MLPAELTKFKVVFAPEQTAMFPPVILPATDIELMIEAVLLVVAHPVLLTTAL
jgi:hypothetical protein